MEVVNTDKIQLQSLKNYMQEIGYSWFSIDKVFYSPYETNKARTTVSLRSAVLAHNGYYNEIHGRGFEPDTVFGDIPYEWWCAAQKAKIVYGAKLQYSKKRNAIITQSHMVRFTEPENVPLFIK